MKIEVGKFYVDREGTKHGPLVQRPGDAQGVLAVKYGENWVSWWPDGRRDCAFPDPRDLIAEWVDKPKTWAEMTDAEKGALLLAHHEHKQIEVEVSQQGSNWKPTLCPTWSSEFAYRIKPEPVVETMTKQMPALPDCNEANVNEAMGMTLRDYFAAKALPEAIKLIWEDDSSVKGNAEAAAIWAYTFADAMLIAREYYND